MINSCVSIGVCLHVSYSYTHYNIPVGCVSVAFVVTLTDTLLSSSFPDIPLSAITVIV